MPRTANATSFKPGFDERRHHFKHIECVVGGLLGYRECLRRHPHLRHWLQQRATDCTRARMAKQPKTKKGKRNGQRKPRGRRGAP